MTYDERRRLEVRFFGRVQGVGFRYTTSEIARGFDVTGYVENLPDGQVLLVAEGLPEELRGFVQAIRERMAGNIRGVDEIERPADGRFERFEIRS